MAKSRGARDTAAPPNLRTSRLRLVDATVARSRGSRVSVTVVLDHDGDEFTGSAAGVGLEAVELRLAAIAMLDAIRHVTDDDRFRLVGIKKLRAFDVEVILAVLTDATVAARRYAGAVPVGDDVVRGAAAAVLHALNRALGRNGDDLPT